MIWDKLVHQFDERHLRSITLSVPELEDPGVATRTLHEARRDVVEELSEDLAVLDLSGRQTPGMKVAPASQGDEPLGVRPKLLGLCRRRLDPLVPKQRGRHVAH